MSDDNDSDDIAERRAHGRKVLNKIAELNRRSLARAPKQERQDRGDDEWQRLYAAAMAEKRK